MQSLVFLCARRLLGHRPGARRALPFLPSELYPVLFQAAFVDGRALALQDLVTSWPFPVLSFQCLLGRCGHPRHRAHRAPHSPDKLCVQAVLAAVVAHVRRELEESQQTPSDRQCHLRVLDMTGLQDDDSTATATARGPEGMSLWSGTVALAKACLEVAKHQREVQKHNSKRRRTPSGSSSPPHAVGVEIRADLFVNGTSSGVLRDALQATGSPLRLRCRDFHAEELSVTGIVALLECLDPGGVRRVDLRFNNLGLAGLCAVVPQLSRFPDLLSLKLPYSNVDVRRHAAGADAGFRRLATHLGKLRALRELNLGSSRLSGKLRQLLRNLEAPLESLELAFCYLLPGDLAFLSQSIHAPALKKLDLSGHHFTESLLQPLCSLLENSSCLLHLDLMECQLTDSRLEALLPSLCRCSRLRCLGLFGNPLSTPGLKTLLRQTSVLPDLCLVVYPYPVDCYSRETPRAPAPSAGPLEDALDEERFTAVSAELCRMLVSSGRDNAMWTASLCRQGTLDYFALGELQPNPQPNPQH
ncbi:leucine-rich repeat-containing protein 14-like [Pezoporus flaviventris]|uniref:leucine-rich repeat-containing protein 14-like n=1 Tax=Pezoporus flaviventris TaxID=889875 RepID=UPI002AB1B7E5|nr:leucine-rich repeat-containing protein 14-like [Pezoporus flaviventris]